METRVLACLLLISLLSSCEKKSDPITPSNDPSETSQADKSNSKWNSIGRNRQNGSTSLSSLEEEDIEAESAKFQSWTIDELDAYLEKSENSLSQENAWLYGIALHVALLKNESHFADRVMSLQPEAYRLMGYSVCQLFVKHHPELLAAKVERYNFDNQEERSMLISVWANLYKFDPETAKRLIESSENQWGAGVVAFAMAENDPEAAFRFAAGLGNESQRSEALVAAVQKTVQTSPTSALEFIKSVPYDAHAWQALFDNWIKEPDSQAAIDEFGKLSKDRQALLLSGSGMVEAIAKYAPDMAVDVIDSIPFTEQNRQLYSRLAMSLADRDPSKAMDYLRTLPDGDASKEIAGQVFERLARMNPDSATAKIPELPTEYQFIATRSVARAIAKEDPVAAFKLAEGVEPSQRQDVYREVARQVTYSNPQEAVKLLEDSKLGAIVGEGFRSEMLDHTVRGWAKQDLDAARSWVENLPAADVPKGVQGLMNPWMKADPVAASAWLAKLPAGPARDAGAQVVISQTESTDPEMAERWRKSLTPQPGNGN